MKEIFLILFNEIEKSVSSFDKRVEIYEELIPALQEYDYILAEELVDEDEAYDKAFRNFFNEDEEDEDEDRKNDW